MIGRAFLFILVAITASVLANGRQHEYSEPWKPRNDEIELQRAERLIKKAVDQELNELSRSENLEQRLADYEDHSHVERAEHSPEKPVLNHIKTRSERSDWARQDHSHVERSEHSKEKPVLDNNNARSDRYNWGRQGQSHIERAENSSQKSVLNHNKTRSERSEKLHQRNWARQDHSRQRSDENTLPKSNVEHNKTRSERSDQIQEKSESELENLVNKLAKSSELELKSLIDQIAARSEEENSDVTQKKLPSEEPIMNLKSADKESLQELVLGLQPYMNHVVPLLKRLLQAFSLQSSLKKDVYRLSAAANNIVNVFQESENAEEVGSLVEKLLPLLREASQALSNLKLRVNPVYNNE